AIFLIPAALCFTFGEMVGDRRQGLAVLASMTAIFVAMACVAALAGHQANPALAGLPVDSLSSAWQDGGNMEGKETR
ncbi:UNVERIFIED_CONTAM: potassium-transporting ATPase subunit KdpA, partial [Salmonella enterica subsp. enterica serovar Weltevreden]